MTVLGGYDSTAGAELGNVRLVSGVGNPFLHQGLFCDVETRSYQNRARQYHPRLGRFIQRDPLGYVDGANLYQYLGSAPNNFVDPSGLNSTLPSGDVPAGGIPVGGDECLGGGWSPSPDDDESGELVSMPPWFPLGPGWWLNLLTEEDQAKIRAWLAVFPGVGDPGWEWVSALIEAMIDHRLDELRIAAASQLVIIGDPSDDGSRWWIDSQSNVSDWVVNNFWLPYHSPEWINSGGQPPSRSASPLPEELPGGMCTLAFFESSHPRRAQEGSEATQPRPQEAQNGGASLAVHQVAGKATTTILRPEKVITLTSLTPIQSARTGIIEPRMGSGIGSFLMEQCGRSRGRRDYET